jgi:hypothetical protein
VDIIKLNRAPALVVIFLVLFFVAMIYLASQLPAYSPYSLDEQFTSLDPNVWEIGGMRNYSLSNGVLTLFGSTNATHYFITNPKWQSHVIETRLQGSLEITFKADEATNSTVIVASTDSWTALAYSGMLILNLGGTTNSMVSLFKAEMSPGWHTFVAENSAHSIDMSLDGRLIAVVDRWDGNLTRLDLGTGLSSFDGYEVRGDLAVRAVKADLQPLIQPEMLTTWNVQGMVTEVLRHIRTPQLDGFHRVPRISLTRCPHLRDLLIFRTLEAFG